MLQGSSIARNGPVCSVASWTLSGLTRHDVRDISERVPDAVRSAASRRALAVLWNERPTAAKSWNELRVSTRMVLPIRISLALKMMVSDGSVGEMGRRIWPSPSTLETTITAGGPWLNPNRRKSARFWKAFTKIGAEGTAVRSALYISWALPRCWV